MTTPQGMVDWDLAGVTARRLIRPGPPITRSEADAAIESLRRYADQAAAHVTALTRMTPPESPALVRVVDRAGWVDANLEGLAALMDPLIERLDAKRPGSVGRIASNVGPRLTGVEAGAVMSFLSARVLGQFEIAAPGAGQLLLVAPNIVEVERALGVDPNDFRLWVCLHEVTHWLQFTAVPWLRDHLHGEVERLVDAIDLDPEALRRDVGAALRELAQLVRNRQHPESGGLLALVHNPKQRAVLDRVTAVMSLVEGHAEHVMDEVGPGVVPSVAVIRERFSARRRGASPFDRLVRRLMGLDMKMRQYADGRAFVGGVVSQVGMDGFNAVWTSPDTLPNRAEIADPAAWVERVHGIGRAETA